MRFQHVSNHRGWILYDARCPLCAGGARLLGPALHRRGYHLMPLQRRWVRDRLQLPETELLRESRVLLADGSLIGAAQAYVHVSRRIWWAAPLVPIAKLPGGIRLLGVLYRAVARNRFAISRWLGLKLPHRRRPVRSPAHISPACACG